MAEVFSEGEDPWGGRSRLAVFILDADGSLFCRYAGEGSDQIHNKRTWSRQTVIDAEFRLRYRQAMLPEGPASAAEISATGRRTLRSGEAQVTFAFAVDLASMIEDTV